MAQERCSGTVTKDDQRSYIKIETLRGKNPSDIHESLREVCGNQSVDRSTVSRWATRFKAGRTSIQDEPRPGRPKTATHDNTVERVRQVLDEDRRMTCDEIATAVGISHGTAYQILTTVLQKRKVSARWVPHQLTDAQKAARKANARKLLARYKRDRNAFLDRIVAIDETWVRDFEPELKSQSAEWRSPSSPRPQKFRRALSKVKQMMIFAYDSKGIIYTDRVPPGTTVTSSYYRSFLQALRRKMHKTRPDTLAAGVLLLHDNARPHIGATVMALLASYVWEVLPHAPYSPDLSPPDFDLFPKLKMPMRGMRFANLEDLSRAVTQRIRQLNNNKELTGIQDLPKRWRATIDKGGDYIEGL